MQIAQPLELGSDLRLLTENELDEVNGGFWPIVAAVVFGLGAGFFLGVLASGRIHREP